MSLETPEFRSLGHPLLLAQLGCEHLRENITADEDQSFLQMILKTGYVHVHNICPDNIEESKYPVFVQMMLRSNLDKIPVSCDRDSQCARGGTCA